MSLRPPAKDWEIPELEVTSRSRPKHRTPTKVSSEGTDRAFELDLVPTFAPTKRHRAKAPSPAELADFDERVLLGSPTLDLADVPRANTASPTPSSLPWPDLFPRKPSEQPVDPGQVQVVLPWGEPPVHLFETPTYALGVFRGQRALLRQIREQQKLIIKLDGERQEIALEWFDSHCETLRVDPRFEKAFAALSTIEQTYQSTALEYNQQLAEGIEVKQQIVENQVAVSTRLEQKRSELGAEDALREQVSLTLQREQAKRKRLDIDRRSGLVDAGSFETRGATLNALIAQIAAQLQTLDVRLNAKKHAVYQTELELRRGEDKLRGLARRYQARVDATQVGLCDVLTAQENAKLELMQQVLAQRDSGLVDTIAREQLLTYETRLVSQVQKLAVLLATYAAFDRSKVQHGLRILLVAVGMPIILLFVRCMF